MTRITRAMTFMLLFFSSIYCFSQQGDVWTFGSGAMIDFNGGGTILTGTSSISSYEGCATMSDNSGNLLFYTDGITIWNQVHGVMTTGLLGHWSSAQCGIIVPEPGVTAGTYTDRYYVFSVPQLGSGQVRYTLVDMSVGLGNVVGGSLNTLMPDNLTANNTTEGITVARNCSNDGFWVITHETNNNRFKAYEVTNSGVSMPTISNVGPVVPITGGNINSAACMKMSPSNNRLAFIVRQTSVNLLDFDPSTGAISTNTSVVTSAGQTYYGVEFSPDGNVLYYTNILTGLYAYNISLGTTSANLAGFIPTASNLLGAMQLGPNGNIYVGRDGDSNMGNLNQTSLGVITNPNSFPGAVFNPAGLALAPGTGVKIGLPNIIPSLITPQPHITGDNLICLGESTTITASGGTIYTWSPPTGLNTTTGPTVIASPTSTQTYTVASSLNGCSFEASFTVTVENCCSAANDSTFQTAPNFINTDTYWTEKMYIPDGIIVTVNNAILDLTNVDLVFGECAGIDFVNGAKLRANNSVFRPCNMDETWRGLRFDGFDDISHQINECTFKNAEIALLFVKNAQAEVNSNTFSNCNEGVTLDNSRFSESIFGNNFVTNNAYPQFTNCYQTTSPNDIIHIHGAGSPNEIGQAMMIVQNNFTMSNDFGIIQATGIDLLNSSASISENTMTNMEFGIVITNPNAQTNIEGNEIENNFNFNSITGSIAQISLFGSKGSFVSINNNELRNSINDGSISTTSIYLESSTNTHIQNNEIQGVDFGISLNSSNRMNVSENLLSSIGTIGIYLNEPSKKDVNFITCNDITMITGRGAGISTLQASNLTNITSNCIKDGREGIRVNGTGIIPLIRNNYLYNYSTGIANIGHTGNIGTSSDPGMNTLWSNNNSSFDIASSGASISIANNFGMFNCTWGTVSITANNPIHSTASCGHQIFNMPSQGSLNPNYTCDNMSSFILPAKQMNGNIELPEITHAVAYLQDSKNKLGTIAKLVHLDECSDTYLENLLNQVSLTDEERSYIWYNYFKKQSDFTNAQSSLLGLTSEHYQNLVTLEKFFLKKLEGFAFSNADFDLIESIINSDIIDYSTINQAVGLSKTGNAHGYYRISNPSLDDLTYDQSSRIEEEKTLLSVHPNPTTDNLTVEILEGKIAENQGLKIFDMKGNIVLESSVDFISGRTLINVSTLESGMYFILLSTDGNYSERTRFTKL